MPSWEFTEKEKEDVGKHMLVFYKERIPLMKLTKSIAYSENQVKLPETIHPFPSQSPVLISQKTLSLPQEDMKTVMESDIRSNCSLFCPQDADIALEQLTMVRASGQVMRKRSSLYSS